MNEVLWVLEFSWPFALAAGLWIFLEIRYPRGDFDGHL